MRRNYSRVFFAFAFVPWVQWSVANHHLIQDGKRFTLGIGSDCAHVKNKFIAEFAVTEAARSKGLSGKERVLGKYEGMLFVFNREDMVSFWMKDTHIPLDILFFNAKGVLTQKLSMPVEKKPEAPTENYPSLKPTLLALEVPFHGFSPEVKNQKLCVESR